MNGLNGVHFRGLCKRKGVQQKLTYINRHMTQNSHQHIHTQCAHKTSPVPDRKMWQGTTTASYLT